MSLSSAVTLLRGVKDTYDKIDSEQPIEISNTIWMTDPNMNRGLTWAMSEAGKSEAGNHIFYHLEDAPFPNFVQYLGATETAQAVTALIFSANTAKKVQEASRIYFPKSNQIIRLTATCGSDTTTAGVSRNFGRGTAASYLIQGEMGLVLPPAFAQGFTTLHGLSNSRVVKWFSMSEVSYPVEVNNVAEAETWRGGKPFEVALKKTSKLAKNQMEAEMYFGGKVDSNTLYATPVSASEGMENYISTNVISAEKMSRLDFMDIIGMWAMKNPGLGAIHCSGWFKSMVTNWGIPFLEMSSEETTLGLGIDRIRTPWGIVELTPIDLFNQDAALAGKIFFIPSGHINYRYLPGMDLHYRPIALDNIHSKFGELYGMYGWEFAEEELFLRVDGLRFAA